MALIEWQQDYELGIPALDFEHKDLCERVNDLYAECRGADDRDFIIECLGRIQARLAAHFALEEKTMLEMRNPHFEAHKAEHDRFLDEVTEVVAVFDEQDSSLGLEAFAVGLRDWIVRHITTYDRQLLERGD